ncbi:MAG: DUF983 domain-containing protein [Devosiaceae bacterium]|nr:DUF983 domain-containing protein [Devosiaceae bacterium MH13]
MSNAQTASPLAAGARGRCPRCGQGKLFKGYLTVADRCSVCDLDYGFADAGDGPAVFITFFAGFIVVGVALWLELAYAPPYWVHAAVGLPLVLLTCLVPLRPLKGWMIARQYQMDARETRHSDIDTPDP